jgi:DNA-binding LytR/AlgR family response regulator
MLRALIVDDEPGARKVLREELDSVTNVEVVGEAENGEVALVLISAEQPDLVFLDIQMPTLGGFELLDRLVGGRMPVIIMVTAYDQQAIRAFEAGAVDYLLKPVGKERLLQAVERAGRIRRDPREVAESLVRLQEIVPVPESREPRIRKIVGKRADEYFLLSPEEVLAFRATGDLVWIVTGQRRYLATQNLKTIEERLQHSSFRRIHRNALVNINQIRKISMITSQRWLITLSNGDEFVVSKRQARDVRDILSW